MMLFVTEICTELNLKCKTSLLLIPADLVVVRGQLSVGTAAVSVRKWRSEQGTRNAKVRAEWKLISSFGLLPQLLLPAGYIVNHTLNSV